MFKIIIALSLLFVAQAQLIGGFVNRPDLVSSDLAQSLVSMSVENLASSQNLRVFPLNIISVSTQLVNGINYRVEFVGRTSSNTFTTCTLRAYQSFTSEPTISSVSCL